MTNTRRWPERISVIQMRLTSYDDGNWFKLVIKVELPSSPAKVHSRYEFIRTSHLLRFSGDEDFEPKAVEAPV